MVDHSDLEIGKAVSDFHSCRIGSSYLLLRNTEQIGS